MKRGKFLAFPALIWITFFFLVPLLFVLAYSFFERGPYGDVIMIFTMQNIIAVFQSQYMKILWNTLVVAVVTTFFTLLIGYPYAYTIMFVSKKWQHMLLMLITIPFWINFLVRSYAWIVILRTQGLINTLLMNIGLIEQPLNLLYNTPAVILGMVYTLLPFMVLPIYVAIEQMDHRKIEAAYDLGATPIRTFLHVTFPMTISGVATGSVLVFVASLGMFIVSDVMGGARVPLIGNVIQSQFLGARNWPFGSALSLVLVVACVMLIFVYYRLTSAKNRKRGER